MKSLPLVLSRSFTLCDIQLDDPNTIYVFQFGPLRDGDLVAGVEIVACGPRPLEIIEVDVRMLSQRLHSQIGGLMPPTWTGGVPLIDSRESFHPTIGGLQLVPQNAWHNQTSADVTAMDVPVSIFQAFRHLVHCEAVADAGDYVTVRVYPQNVNEPMTLVGTCSLVLRRGGKW